MNKKEIAEIKRQFKLDNDDMLINNIAVYYINKENEIICSAIKRFTEQKDMLAGKPDSENSWGQLDEEYFIEIFKKTLGGQLGKGLVEYVFPTDILTGKDNCYTKLTDLLNGHLEDKKEVDSYVTFIANCLNKNEEYAICIASCTYTLPTKDINGFKVTDDSLISSSDEFDFIILSVCPIALTKIGLYYNKSKDTIEHKENTDKIIEMPIEGFIFPVFNDRTTDINNVLIYNKKSKEPDKALINSALGCNFVMTSDEEQEKFNLLITKIISDSNDLNIGIDYKVTQAMHQIISEKISSNILDTELTTISKGELKSILKQSGVSDEKLEKYDEVYEDVIKNKNYQFKAVNAINASKLNIKSPDVVINVNSDASDKVTAQIIDGKRCLVVELDENVDINGLNVKIK